MPGSIYTNKCETSLASRTISAANDGGETLTWSRVNEGLPREGGVTRSLQEGKVGCVLDQSDRRKITAAV